jgi:hypothetical protein
MGRGPDVKKGMEKKVKPGFAQFVFKVIESLPIQ